ncbi:replication-relaxation family protein [Clostridium saccharoperbutylacetonicum]|uniref:replication-relaxation family protein n=1 Tax=Clostridium saccharoperbutylacetonicum TaxID=36745 RepID=UPI0039E95A1F
MKRDERIIKPEDVTERFIMEYKFTICQREAIKLIYQMRIMSTTNIAKVFDKNEEFVRNELVKLYRNGFLHRILSNDNGSVGYSAYWMLDRGGALYIAGAYQVSLKKINWDVRSNLIAYEKLSHAIKISDVMTQLTIAAREKGHSVEDAYCDRHLYYKFTTADNKKSAIYPDLAINYNDGTKLYQFFFEIDRGTMAIMGPKNKNSVVINKVPRYEEFCLSQEWKNYFEVFPRIVFLTNTKSRAKKMLEAIQSTRESKLEFLVSTFEAFEMGTLEEIFLSTNKEKAINLFE